MHDRNKKFDIARGIGILLITLGHCKVPAVLNHYIYAFHVPLFFVIAGCIFDCGKYRNPSVSMKMVAIKKAKSYLLPYCVMYAINTMIIAFSWQGLNIFGFVSNILHYFVWMLASTEVFPHCEPLWFLPCLYLAYIIFFVIMRKNSKFIYCISVPILACLYWLKASIDSSLFYWHADVALLGASFMLIGYYIEHSKVRKKTCQDKRAIIVISLSLLIGVCSAKINISGVDLNHLKTGNLMLFFLHSTFLSLACIDISACLEKTRLGNVFSYFGRNTLPIMGFNFQCILIARRLLAPTLGASFYWILEFVLSCILLLGVVQIWNYGKLMFDRIKRLLLRTVEKI